MTIGRNELLATRPVIENTGDPERVPVVESDLAPAQTEAPTRRTSHIKPPRIKTPGLY